MLAVSFGLTVLAALIGGVLAMLQFRTSPPAWPLGAMHGLFGVGGLLGLLVALRGPPRGVGVGVGSFGYIAAILLGLALSVGMALAFVRLGGRRPPHLLIGIHATLAISGGIVLAAYALVG
jgi:hypothetical protein